MDLRFFVFLYFFLLLWSACISVKDNNDSNQVSLDNKVSYKNENQEIDRRETINRSGRKRKLRSEIHSVNQEYHVQDSNREQSDVKEKIENVFFVSTQVMLVNIACHSREDAFEAAKNFGGNNYLNTPLDVIRPANNNKDRFPCISLGRENKKIVVERDGIYYDYRFNYGMNENGFLARKEEGCDEPDPYFTDKFIVPLSHGQRKRELASNNKLSDKSLPTELGSSFISKENSYEKENRRNRLKRFNGEIKDVCVACHSKEDAYEAALKHGYDGYYNTPIEDPIHYKNNRNEFPHFHLGRNNEKRLVRHKGIDYNYHYNFGRNSFNKEARKERGCDVPDPYYY